MKLFLNKIASIMVNNRKYLDNGYMQVYRPKSNGRGVVSSLGNPQQALTRFNLGSLLVAMAHLLNLLDILRELCKGLTKC